METDQLLDDSVQPSTVCSECGNIQQPTSQPSNQPSNNNDDDDPLLNIEPSTLCEHCRGNSDDYGAILASAASADIRIKVYKQRWYVLFMFSFLALMQGGLCNVWTVISESAGAAFGWSNMMISLMQGWLYVAFLVTMFPASLFMDSKGLRPAIIISAVFVVIGAALRCITTHTPYVTWLAHAGQIFNGMAAPVMYTAGPVISALWFPPGQRATATAISTVAGFAGNAACFLVGPLLIQQPHAKIGPPSKNISGNFTNLAEIKQEILYCRYGECGICIILLFCFILYFPSKPRRPPSLTAAMAKVDFRHGFLDLFRRRNANFWLVGVPYGFIISIYSVWTSLFDQNLQSLHVTESEAGWLGFWGVASGCTAAVLVGRLADSIAGYMKPFLVCMNVGSVLATFGFLMIAEGYIPYSKIGLYACAICQGIFCNGSIPLFYELAIEATYPVAEVATSAVLNILYNVLPLFFLVLFLIPNFGENLQWMNWVMYGSVLLSFPMLLAFKEKYRRSDVDKKAHAPNESESDNSVIQE